MCSKTSDFNGSVFGGQRWAAEYLFLYMLHWLCKKKKKKGKAVSHRMNPDFWCMPWAWQHFPLPLRRLLTLWGVCRQFFQWKIFISAWLKWVKSQQASMLNVKLFTECPEVHKHNLHCHILIFLTAGSVTLQEKHITCIMDCMYTLKHQNYH